jgi:hypothetical protein
MHSLAQARTGSDLETGLTGHGGGYTAHALGFARVSGRKRERKKERESLEQGAQKGYSRERCEGLGTR